MNITQNTVLIAIAALATSTFAAEGEGFPERGQRHEEMRKKMMMRRFDANKDGKIDEAEKAEMDKKKKEIMEKYDKDGDGQLGPEERKAFMDERRKEMGGNEGMGPEGGPGRMTAEKRKEIMGKFDKDGDGKLNDEERKAAFEAHKKRVGGDQAKKGAGMGRGGNPEQRKMMMEKYDTDGDGKLNDAERAKLREALQKRAEDGAPPKKAE